MTKKSLLFSVLAIFAYLIVTSEVVGTATAGSGNKTGGPGSNGQTCALSGCHTSGIGTTTGGFEVRKKFKPDSNTVVNSYLPDSVYLVRLSGSHTTLNKFGFQLMALKVKDSSNAGTFSNLGAKMKTATSGGRNLLEHSDTMSKPGGGIDIIFTWKAPAKNSGQVRFYAVLNAVNGDGASGGDKPSNTIIHALAESLSIPNTNNESPLKLYPNPVNTTLNIQRSNTTNGTYLINVYDNFGKKIHTSSASVSNGTFSEALSTKQWASGLYIVQVTHEGKQYLQSVIKQ